MLLIYNSTLYLHIALGTLALFVFWVPVFARKGSKNHRSWGKLFSNCMYAVAISGLIMSTLVWIDPIAIRYSDQTLTAERAARINDFFRNLAQFLFLLSVLTFISVKHALLVLKARADRSQLKHWSHLIWFAMLLVMSVKVLILGINTGFPLYIIFGCVGLIGGLQNLRYIFKREISQREWIIEHLSSILGTGIAVYTAFFAVGGRHWLSQILTGNLQLIPWVLPGVIGTVAIVYLKRKYGMASGLPSRTAK